MRYLRNFQTKQTRVTSSCTGMGEAEGGRAGSVWRVGSGHRNETTKSRKGLQLPGTCYRQSWPQFSVNYSEQKSLHVPKFQFNILAPDPPSPRAQPLTHLYLSHATAMEPALFLKKPVIQPEKLLSAEMLTNSRNGFSIDCRTLCLKHNQLFISLSKEVKIVNTPGDLRCLPLETKCSQTKYRD